MSDESITSMVINLRYQQAVEEEVKRERDAFTEDLKTILKERGWTTETLAERLGVCSRTVARWIGQRDLSFNEMARISIALEGTFHPLIIIPETILGRRRSQVCKDKNQIRDRRKRISPSL